MIESIPKVCVLVSSNFLLACVIMIEYIKSKYDNSTVIATRR